tara:strand:+ start:55 stop:420 length:366 start_codon:yes stop_codon:yes gene_type:complete
MGKAHKFLVFSLLFFTSISINYCYDGDTCTSDKGEKIRLACIDAPELKGPEANPKKAKAARNHLRDLVYKKNIQIRRITKDHYGRTVGELFADGLNLQEQMVKDGHAKIYKKYAFQCEWSK